ncbi:TRAP transporter permease [Helicobacter muridarum]|uniref:Neu5Ac permease n=2 Tax=Helicobacter muridarum TaxID=216 RepID=A0A099TZT9_9HELI|nr:TRAP transporter permease [Helicobacter muridarum]STQ85686.1 Neu5Ac permease [Helicobacter muridarum]
MREPGGYECALIKAVLIAYSLFHLYITFYPLPELLLRSVHLCGGMALIFLLFRQSKFLLWDYILFFSSILGFVYIFYEFENIVSTRGGLPNNTDIIFAILTTILVLEAARRVTGLILPCLTCLFLIYPFISHFDFMPPLLITREYDLGDIFGQLYLKTEGLFSSAIGASSNFIFLFILFGAFLSRSGMSSLFNDLSLALAGMGQGGPAKVAVISSGLMGSINGAAVANVVSTGSFTIPLMKKIGYDKNFAAAVEASASIGGQILPPIMGASAFIMAETLGTTYSTIAIAATLPALLYFLSVLAGVHFYAKKHNLKGMSKDSIPSLKIVLKQKGHMLLPMILLIVLLANSMAVAYAAIYTIFFTVIISQVRKETRMNLKDIMGALEDGAKNSLSVVIACGVVGIIIGVTSLTSFGNVVSSSIVSLGQGYLFLSLILTMLASIILGMGLPSIPAYIITATMAAPALASFNIPAILAHIFVFYFGIFANITPPVALASFAAAGIAKSDPMKTSFYALRLSLVGFVIPFIFIYNPELLMLDFSANSDSFANLQTILMVSLTSIIGVLALCGAIEAYLFGDLAIWQRILLGFGGFCFLIPGLYSDILGANAVGLVFTLQFIFKNKLQH